MRSSGPPIVVYDTLFCVGLPSTRKQHGANQFHRRPGKTAQEDWGGDLCAGVQYVQAFRALLHPNSFFLLRSTSH